MSIQMPSAEVYALAQSLQERAAEADEAQYRLSGPVGVGGPLEGAIEAFLLGSRTVGQALAGELRWLSGTITAVADSWLALDGSLLTRARRADTE